MKLTRDELLGLALAAMGLIALLLLAPTWGDPSGPAPLRVLFGAGAVVMAPALTLGGVLIAFAGRLGWQVRWQAIALTELLFLAALTVIQLALPDPLGAALAGRGGGVVGWAIGQAFVDIIGMPIARFFPAIGGLVAAFFLWRALPPAWTAGVAGRLSVGWQDIRATVGHRAQDAGRLGGAWRQRPWGVWPSRAQPTRLAAIQATAAILLARGQEWVRSLRLTWPHRKGAEQDDLAAREESQKAASVPVRHVRAAKPAAVPEPVQSVAPAKVKPTPPGGKTRARSASTLRPVWLPPYDLLRLDQGNGIATAGAASSADTRQRGQLIKGTLAEFGVPVEIVSIKEGPRVTQYGLEPGEIVRELRNGEVLRRRVSVASILRLQNDLALALAAPSLRIEAPVPGRPYVGVEVPNTVKTLVSLRNILEAKEFARVGSPLTVALGRDVSGDPVVADLTRMPHLLIAGATGSGKSVCINALICSLLMNNAPETVRLIMIDPKMVELPSYNGIPHLLGPVITETSQATGALAWLMLQMDDRYRAFADAGARNIVEYNRKLGKGRKAETMPYIVLVIDELADLMMTAAEDIERQICRLAQMARATGIHLVLATQRPSVDVITGLIKANFPSRIAFAVTTQIDSRVILDTPGAEKLLGRGDMLFMAPESSKLARIQGCFVSDQEIDRIVDFWKAAQQEGSPAASQIAPWTGILDELDSGQDELLEQALRLLEGKSHISTSLLQRQLRIGFPRAARLMEQLEEMGVVGTDEGGGRSREVLLQAESDSGVR